MKLSKLVLENFQSHSHTELELADTLTVIVGESDQGKSAIVRAIQWLMFNEPRGADFIRVGTDTCRVSGHFADGTVVARERNRTGSKNRYVITRPDGSELVLDGVGSSVPPEVGAITGVKPLMLDGKDSINVNFGGQLEAPFLLSDNGHTRARAIGRLTGTHLFDQARQRSAQEARRAEQQVKRLREDAQAVSDHLASYADVPRMEAALLELEQMLTRLRELELRRETLTRLYGNWQALASEIMGAEVLLQGLAKLNEAGKPLQEASNRAASLGQLRRHQENLTDIYRQLDLAHHVIQDSHGLGQAQDNLVQLEKLPLGQLQLLGQELAKVETSLVKAREYIPRFDGLSQSDAIREKSAKAHGTWQLLIQHRAKAMDIDRELVKIEKSMASGKAIVQGEALVASIDPLRLSRLGELASMLKAKEREISQADQERLRAEQSLAAQAGEYTRLLTAASQCPLCSSPLDKEKAARIVKEQLQGGAKDGGDLGAADKPA